MQKIGTAGPEMVIDVVNSAKINSGEQQVHVCSGVDRHSTVANLTETAAVVRVSAHQGRHVERDTESAASSRQDHLVTFVGLLGVAKAGELPDRPGTATIATWIEAAREGKFSRPTDPLHAVVESVIVRPVHRIDLDTGNRRVIGFTHLTLGLRLGKGNSPTILTARAVCSH
jgi:hypothetical protein